MDNENKDRERAAASASLQAVETMQQRTHTAVGGRQISLFYFIWGIVWLAGFLFSQYGPARWLIWTWGGLLMAGGILSTVVGLRLGQRVRYEQTGPRLAGFFAALFGFGAVWLWLAQPQTWQETAVWIVSLLLFGAVVAGVWLQSRALIGAGVIGTAVLLAIYVWLWPYLGLLLGLLGGGSLLLAGWWQRRSA